MIDISKKYKTAANADVQIYTTEGPGKYPVVGVVESESVHGRWHPNMWDSNGKSPYGKVYDLTEVPKAVEIPIHIAYDPKNPKIYAAYTAEKAARKTAFENDWNYMNMSTTVEVEVE